MTDKEIIEGNKLIAEIMGYIINPANEWYNFEGACMGNMRTPVFDLKYHASWNRLMPVFKKIWESIDQFQYDDEPYLYITEEIFHPDYLLSDFINNNIESVWNRCVEFIKWYNEQKEGGVNEIK